MYAAPHVKAIVVKTPLNWAAELKVAPVKQTFTICLFWKSDNIPISPMAYTLLNTADDNLCYNEMQTR